MEAQVLDLTHTTPSVELVEMEEVALVKMGAVDLPQMELVRILTEMVILASSAHMAGEELVAMVSVVTEVRTERTEA